MTVQYYSFIRTAPVSVYSSTPRSGGNRYGRGDEVSTSEGPSIADRTAEYRGPKSGVGFLRRGQLGS